MKIAVCSDLHLEFGDLDLQNTDNADVLVLSGDILVASDLEEFVVDESSQIVTVTQSVRQRGQRFYDFMVRCSERFPNIIYVMGNHEHYHGDFAKTSKIIQNTFGHLKNVHFLDKEFRVIDGVLFFGGTVWTDMNNQDVNTMQQIRHMMNDYRTIMNSDKPVTYKIMVPDPEVPGGERAVFKQREGVLSPLDTVEDHFEFRRRLDAAMEQYQDLPVVVCGHHAPSKLSTHPRYAGEVLVNGAYSTNMDEYITERSRIVLWTHGHTHEHFDYIVGETRIFCNPRGYINYEHCADEFVLKSVEI